MFHNGGYQIWRGGDASHCRFLAPQGVSRHTSAQNIGRSPFVHVHDTATMPLPTDDEMSMTWRVSPDLLGILTVEGYFERSNPAWQTTLGWSAEELRKTQFIDLLHPDDLAGTKQAFEHLKLGNPILRYENRYRSSDGAYHWLSWVAVPEGGKFYCSARDVTDAKAETEALVIERVDAELREQFIAVLGHDLRNPLASISSGVRMAKKEPQSDKAERILTLMQGSILRMSILIDNLMDFARGRLGGGITVSQERYESLEAVLTQVVDELREGTIDSVINTDFLLNDAVQCDPSRIAQLTSNLLGNAITHGAAKEPILLTATTNGAVFELSVSNKGTPIPPATMKYLFRPFFRGEVRQSQQGLGLGLYIVSEIAKAHGGELAVASTPQDTRFTFTMPISQSTP